MEELPPGPLRLAVSRVGDELRFEVGPLSALEFWDPSPRGSQSGRFAVYWPAGARLTELLALRQALPATHSPLEAGDESFAAGQFGEALEAYRRQVRAFGSAETGQEARYKQAVCLLALGRDTEADALLAEVAAGSGGRWALLAGCRLWLRRLTQGQVDEADALFDTLVVRHRAQSVAALVPYTLQRPILDAYAMHGQRLNLYRVDPRLPKQCRRALEIMEFFEVPDDTRDWLQFAVLRAHRAVGQEAEALEAAAQFLQPPSAGNRDQGRTARGPGESRGANLVCEYAWLLRTAGRRETALAEIERLGNLMPRDLRGDRPVQWTLERVRCLWVLGRFSEAEAALDSLLGRSTAEDLGENAVSAWLLKGFLRRRAGDEAGAQQAWKKAGPHRLDADNGFKLTDWLIATSLRGAFTEADAKAVLARLTAEVGEGPNRLLIQSSLGELVFQPKTIVAVANHLFHNRWGEGLARKVAFRETPLRDCLRVIPSLVIYEFLHESAMPQQLADDQADLLWKLSNDTYTAVIENHAISKGQFLQMGLAWKGIMNFLGWGGVAPTLPPELRGALAYVLGHRYLRLGRPEDAAGLFRTAAADAPPGSPLRKLAEAELQRLAKPAVPPGKK
jgi:tetratricopeptide (TPR) repeat protein